MEELYLSSDALRFLSQITRYLILHHNTVIKMSDQLVLVKVFEACEKLPDTKLQNMLMDLTEEISKPIDGDATSFVFLANDTIMKKIHTEDKGMVNIGLNTPGLENYR